MEARLAAAARRESTETDAKLAVAPVPDELAASVAADAVPLQDDMPPLWPDETAEVSFLAEARARGEPVMATPAARAENEEAAEPRGALPALDELVRRIPAEAREALDDLFRAKFTAVRRVPAKALKG